MRAIRAVVCLGLLGACSDGGGDLADARALAFETVLEAAPAAATNVATARFAFRADGVPAGAPVTFTCRLDEEVFPCASPLEREVAPGDHVFTVAAAVGPVTDDTPAIAAWVLDLTAPEVTLFLAPGALDNSTMPRFFFGADDPGATFQCALDDGAPMPCASAWQVGPLADGPHTVTIWAIDEAGNVGATPVVVSWILDTTLPDTVIDAGPPSLVGAAAQALAFSAPGAGPGATFACRLDGTPLAPCTSPLALTGLATALHVVQVVATTAAGTADPSPATWLWEVDATPPALDLARVGPPSPADVTLAFAAADPHGPVVTTCSLDGAPAAACASPVVFADVGAHELSVVATDALGNAAAPATLAWHHETPDTIITGGPAALVGAAAQQLTFTATGAGAGATFACSVDGAAFAPCTSPVQHALATAAHTFEVAVTTAAGTVDPSPATWTWEVDATPPAIAINHVGPPSLADVTLAFTATDAHGPVTTTCSLDGAPAAACASPLAYSGLLLGPHDLTIVATDALGNASAPAVFPWLREPTALQVVAGGFSSCARFDDGAVKCWGSGPALGLGSNSHRGDGPGELGAALPTVDLGTGRTAIGLVKGTSHTCALLDDATVKCWGFNDYGQLGLGDTSIRGDQPGEMGDALPAVDLGTGRTALTLSTSGGHTCALLDDASVKCWGYNDQGELGLGDTSRRGDAPGEMGDALPAVDLGTGRTAQAIAAGHYHTCALLDDNSLKCWGTSGVLGLANVTPLGDGPGEMGDALPAVDLGTGRTALALTAGYHFTCARLDDASTKCWGANQFGRLGLGDTTNRGDGPGEMGDALPAVDLGTGRTAAALRTGREFACALRDDGSLVCWGDGTYGQLGRGDTNTRGDGPGEMGNALVAVDVGAGRRVVMVAPGTFHACALLDDASVKCWGSNFNGELGVGDTNARGDQPGELGDALPAVDL